MRFVSAYNHLREVKAAHGKTALVLSNLLTGALGMLDRRLFDVMTTAEETGFIGSDSGIDEDLLALLEDRGFLWPDPDAEEAQVRAVGEAQGDRVAIAAGLKGGQYGFITSLHCNLACPYCFQAPQANSTGFLTPDLVDRGIEAIHACEKPVAEANGGQSLPRISITGGEPLLRSRANIEVMDYLMGRLDRLQWPFSITSNGTELAAFVDGHHATPRCRNVQVTLDGPPRIHNSRRAFRGGGPSFEAIATGLERALREGWHLTLRVNLDMSNVGHLPELARIVVDRNWKDHGENFHAYVSPVTDHGGIRGDASPRDEADLLEALLAVVAERPGLREVFDIKHFRGFAYVEQMLVKKEPRFPVVYRCEAVSGMYIFDHLGDVHVCLETVGDPSRRVGRYDPEFEVDAAAHDRWTRRNVLGIERCNGCKVRFVCAGGCTLESFRKSDDEVCMPFLREMDIAWDYFARTRPELF